MRTREEIKALLDKILEKVNAPEAQAEYGFNNSIATRFGENAITQNMGGAEEKVRLIVAYGKKHGSSITNKLEESDLEKMVKRANDIAKNSPEDPEYVSVVEPQDYPKVPQRFYDDVTKVRPQDIANEINKVVKLAKDADLTASGLFEASYGIKAIANSKGLFAFDNNSNVEYSTTMHGLKGSGHSSENGESVTQADAEKMASKAHETALAAQNPADIEPGDYTVIFEPQAVVDLLGFFAWNMAQRDADEGTTVFSGKLGQQIVSNKITMMTKIDDPDIPAPPFGEDGLATKNVTWIDNGVLKRLRHDRFWAKKKDTNPDPILYPVVIEGEGNSVQDLISQCKNGLLVKRLWYIRYVDRKELLLTGMTRDGFFRIKDGKIVGPVKNLRFNESPITFLSNVVALSRPERVGNYAKVPAIMSENFTFSSKTESL